MRRAQPLRRITNLAQRCSPLICINFEGRLILYRCSGAKDMAVSVVGAEDLVVVVTKDAVLVIPKARAQDVRHVVQELKNRGAAQL